MKKTALLLAILLLAGVLAGCGAGDKGEASVQSVSMICGLGSTGLVDRFAGIVSPQGETTLKKDDTMTVEKILVAVGDEVKLDQPLFSYDMAQAQAELDKAQLSLDRMKYELENRKKDKEQLEKDKAGADSDLQLQYSLEIREAEADIQEADYNIKLKEKELVKLEEAVKDVTVKAPVAGRIQSINENGGTDEMGNLLPFMTIVETSGYRVKGYVNENNAGALVEGMAVIIRSRVSDDTWRGAVSSIDFSNPQQNQNYYGDKDTAMSSSYPFYVALEGGGELMLGQHVYIEPDYGQEAEEKANAIMLPEWYINDVDTSPWVWAQSSREKLEKRNITLGEYNPDTGTYEVTDGLSAEDYIAFPDETLSAGMSCVLYDENSFTPEGGEMEGGEMEGGEMEGGEMEGDIIDDGVAVPEPGMSTAVTEDKMMTTMEVAE